MAKRIITFFLIYIAFLISLSFINPVSAQSDSTPTPSYTVGLGAPVTSGEPAPSNFADYTNRIYQFAVVIGISLAVLMIIFGGYKYMGSSGDPQSIAEAKEILVGAVVGLVLILLTRLILATIDPQLLKFPRSAPSFSTAPAANNNPGGGTSTDLDTQAKNLCQNEKAKNRTDWANGPCLTPNLNSSGYAVDIVHNPKQDIDKDSANTCGASTRIFEFDLDCNQVRQDITW